MQERSSEHPHQPPFSSAEGLLCLFSAITLALPNAPPQPVGLDPAKTWIPRLAEAQDASEEKAHNLASPVRKGAGGQALTVEGDSWAVGSPFG